MEELELKDPEDWYRVRNNLRLLCFQHPQFLHDYERICKNIEVKVRELCVLEIELRRHDTIWHKQNRDNKLSDINETIRTFSKILLVATLAKR